jgi:hypothetical protein
MHIHAAVWLLVFCLLFLGIFWYLRGNMHPKGTTGPHHHEYEYKNYRLKGLVVLSIAFVLAYWLYTKEPKVHIYLAE